MILSLSKRYYFRLLRLHKIKRHKVKLYSRKNKKTDFYLRLEYEGSFLKEYFVTTEDVKIIGKLHVPSFVSRVSGDRLVYRVAPNTYLIVGMC